MLRAILPTLLFAGSAHAATPLLCGGVNPSWALEISGDAAVFTDQEGRAISYDIALRTYPDGREDVAALTLIGARDTAIAIIGTRSCRPGNSHTIELLTQRGTQAIMLAGCCRIAPE